MLPSFAGHPQAHLANYTGILQADALGGYIKLYEPARSPGLIREAACWVHARRPFFAMADLEENARRKAAGKKEIVISPVDMEIVRRIDALFEIERPINGQNADQRKAVRQAQSAPLVADLEAYMRGQCAKLSRSHDLAKAMNYMFKRWASFTRFLDDGRVCLSNNAAERALRGIALGRKSWLFCGSDRGGRRAAAMYILADCAREHAPETAAPWRIASAVKPLVEFWQGRTVADISRETCRRFEQHRGRSAGTVRRELGVLRAAINHAFREGRLTRVVSGRTCRPGLSACPSCQKRNDKHT